MHHLRWWTRDEGPTSVDNGISLDLPCHLMVHERNWAITLNPDNSATFTKPDGTSFERPPP